MDIVSISSSISSFVSTDKNIEQSNTSINSGSTGDAVSDSGEWECHLHVYSIVLTSWVGESLQASGMAWCFLIGNTDSSSLLLYNYLFHNDICPTQTLCSLK